MQSAMLPNITILILQVKTDSGASIADPDLTAPRAVRSGSALFAIASNTVICHIAKFCTNSRIN